MIIWVVKIFFVQFCVFLPPLLRSIPFLSLIEPIFAWNVPLVSLIFLKRSLVFHILLFSSISLHWSLRKAFLFLLAIFCNSAFRCFYLSFSPLLFASLLFTYHQPCFTWSVFPCSYFIGQCCYRILPSLHNILLVSPVLDPVNPSFHSVTLTSRVQCFCWLFLNPLS